MDEFKGDIEQSNTGVTAQATAAVEELSVEEVGHLGTLLPWRFPDQNIGSMVLTEIIAVVDPVNKLVKLQIKIVPNRCYTHGPNRKFWTGPYISLNVFGDDGILILKWENIDRINLICGTFQPRYFLRESPIKTTDVARLELIVGSHKYWNC